MIATMHPTSRLVLIALFALVTPATAAIEPMADSMPVSRASGDLDQWQRIDFPSSGLPRRNTAQIKVAIRTKGPSMQGLIRIPGAPASNFDTGKGLAVIDLINVGDEANGYAEIVALEIVITQAMPGQYYQVFAVDDGKEK
ncbi:hypothetical protein UB31_22310 [Bradyrhizobium sp. LTSP849]|uniref:hypothetical protein n=1 Tax=Bradyrhizobium sp. LTSP849 TaxID=1615890 RepID=UPI0005DB79EA|nr:hypothetical protein [Bradyrhizobium sp. LTSP849]KJC43929.1 hypothetical protein UB31_22310 [Bradyrhizobium sp. LTSP849]